MNFEPCAQAVSYVTSKNTLHIFALYLDWVLSLQSHPTEPKLYTSCVKKNLPRLATTSWSFISPLANIVKEKNLISRKFG
jgi:hypothetical protein